MKKKRLLCWLLICAIVAGLTGCGASSQASSNASADNGTTVASSEVVSNNTDAAVAPEPATTEPEPAQAPDTTPAEPAEPTPIQPIPDSEPAPEPEPELPITPSIAPASFQSDTIEWTNEAGYSFLQTYGFSDWIKASDTDLLEVTWNSISDKPIPDLSQYISLGDTWYPKQVYPSLNHPCDEIFYGVGYCTVQNITEGWNITPGNLQNVTMTICCETGLSALGIAWDDGTIVYHAYDNTARKSAISIHGETKLRGKTEDWGRMSSRDTMYLNEHAPDSVKSIPAFMLDTDGPVAIPFLIAIGVVHGPQYPDGAPAISEIHVKGGVRHYEDKVAKTRFVEFLPNATW